ncbi:CHRD domain-containing protein [Sphingosinicella sp.]|uniref:CHRD domain-containing protein n=1 Tax=Sphingosinicella sp. TaxID=1917971 RepID=UPI004037CACD
MKAVWGAAATAALLGACAGGPGMQRAVLGVSMTGIQEVPGPGDPDGNGTVEVRVDPRTGEVCWNLYARQIDPATAAHIHRGAAGVTGPPVLTLTTPDAAGRSQGCQLAELGLAREIGMRGYDFYVNVHTAAQPAGAIRGQLRGEGIIRERSPRRRGGVTGPGPTER